MPPLYNRVMTSTFRSLLLLSGLCGAVTAYASVDTLAMKIVVTNDANAAVAYRGKTDGVGGFATSPLPPGAYVVQFTAIKATALKGSQLSIDVGGGTIPFRSAAVPGEKFGGAGVAMKVELARAAKLSGKVAPAAPLAASHNPSRDLPSNMKIVDGKRYVWTPGGIESRVGKWVEEGTKDLQLPTSTVSRTSAAAMRDGDGSRGSKGDTMSMGARHLEIIDKSGSLHPTPFLLRSAGRTK